VSSKDGKQVDIEVLVATASNDWKEDPLPPQVKEGERRILWPVSSSDNSEEYSLGPGFLW
jgi:hypothetical protein